MVVANPPSSPPITPSSVLCLLRLLSLCVRCAHLKLSTKVKYVRVKKSLFYFALEIFILVTGRVFSGMS